MKNRSPVHRRTSGKTAIARSKREDSEEVAAHAISSMHGYDIRLVGGTTNLDGYSAVGTGDRRADAQAESAAPKEVGDYRLAGDGMSTCIGYERDHGDRGADPGSCGRCAQSQISGRR